MKIFKKIALLSLFSLLLVSCGSKGEELEFHTDNQLNYLKDDYKNYTTYANGTDELSLPKPITLSFTDEKSIILSTNKDFTDSVKYDVLDNKVEIYNLMMNQTYYYKTDLNEKDIKLFTTSSIGPRNLNVDGLTNCRDLGGWKTDDGKYVKQNLIIRTSKYNDDESQEKVITDKGIKTLLNDFKIKTEIDLRRTDNNENGGITASVLGSSVKYVSIPMKSSGNVLTLNPKQIVEVFKILGNSNNYPLTVHCSIGTDRTGLICFLINSLLGVSEVNLYQDYLFSNFGNIGRMRTTSAIDDYLTAVKAKEGKDLASKCENYLIGIGVSKEDIDNLRKIML